MQYRNASLQGRLQDACASVETYFQRTQELEEDLRYAEKLIDELKNGGGHISSSLQRNLEEDSFLDEDEDEEEEEDGGDLGSHFQALLQTPPQTCIKIYIDDKRKGQSELSSQQDTFATSSMRAFIDPNELLLTSMTSMDSLTDKNEQEEVVSTGPAVSMKVLATCCRIFCRLRLG